MGSKLKTGQLTYFSRGLLSKKWRDGFFCLFEDSTIQWFEKQGEKKPEGSIRIRDVAQYFAVGIYTRSFPERPKIPSHGDENLLICIPKDSARKEKEILWIICQDLSQLSEWMTAIVSTLPSATNPSAPALVQSVPSSQQLNQANSAEGSSRSMAPKSDERPTPPAYPKSPSRPVQVSGGKIGEGSYHVQSSQAVVSSGATPSHTTVVVQPSNPQVVVASAGGGGYAAGDGDFALGMLTGAAISSLAAGPRFGCGSGWGGGHGFGYGDWNGHGSGYGGGFGGHHTVINDGPDYTVNNYTINNVTESTTTNNTANTDNYVESSTINFNDDESVHENQVEYGTIYEETAEQPGSGEEHEINHDEEESSKDNGTANNNEGGDNYGDDYGGIDNGSGGGDYDGANNGDGDYGGGADYGGADYGGGDYSGGCGDYGGGDYGGGDYGGGDFGGDGGW